MSETYTLLFPIIIPPSMEMSIDDTSAEVDTIHFRFFNCKGFYLLEAKGFKLESEAVNYINKINVGLKWVTLKKGLPSESSLEPQSLVYSEDPEEAALADINKPAVYKSDKQVAKSILFPPSISAPFPGEDIFRCFIEGLSFKQYNGIIDNNKLCLAIDMYASYFTENSDNARFLTLVMALEVLTGNNRRAEIFLNLIERWMKELNDCKNEVIDEYEKIKELDSLRSSLGHLKNNSITKELQYLVLTTLGNNGDEDAEAMAEKIKDIYNDRSTLVHNGILDSKILKRNIRVSKEIVERVITIKFLEIANRAEN